MKARAQRGTIDNRPVFVIVLILAVIAWVNWPGDPPGATGARLVWVAWAGGILLALLIVGGAIVHRLQARQLQRMNEVARALGSELRTGLSGGFGRYTTTHLVDYRRGGRAVTLDLTSGGTTTTLDVAGAKAAPFSLTFHDGAETVTEYGVGAPRSDAFLNARVRANLERIEGIGKDHYRAVAVIVSPDQVIITKHGRISPRETLLFLNLCWPVFDRALAVCFGQAVAPPAKACATCGGACCATCDTAHAPECGCGAI